MTLTPVALRSISTWSHKMQDEMSISHHQEHDLHFGSNAYDRGVGEHGMATEAGPSRHCVSSQDRVGGKRQQQMGRHSGGSPEKRRELDSHYAGPHPSSDYASNDMAPRLGQHSSRVRSYQSPISPDPRAVEYLPSSEKIRRKDREARLRARDDGMPQISMVDSPFDPTAAHAPLTIPRRSPQPPAGSMEHNAIYGSHHQAEQLETGWSPSGRTSRDGRAVMARQRHRPNRQEARLEQILIRSGRLPLHWPHFREVEHIMHHQWRPPPRGTVVLDDTRRLGHYTTQPELPDRPAHRAVATDPARPLTRGSSGDATLPDWYGRPGSSSSQRPRRQRGYSQGGTVTSLPQNVLTPSYDMDPSRYVPRSVTSGIGTGSVPQQRDYSSHSGGSVYDIYQIDDQPRRPRMLMSSEQQRVLQQLWSIQQREECGDQVGLTNRQVQVWFQNQRQKARKQTAAGAEHAYSAELAQRGRPMMQDGIDSASSSRPTSRDSDALGLVLGNRHAREEHRRAVKEEEVMVVSPASQDPRASPPKPPMGQMSPWEHMSSLNPFGRPSADHDRQYGLPSIRNILDDPSPPTSNTTLPPLRTSPSRHANRQTLESTLFASALPFATGLPRPSLSQGNTPRHGVRERYLPQVPLQDFSDRPELKGGRRHSQPYIKTISTSTMSSTGLRMSPTEPKMIGKDDGGWDRDVIIGGAEARTPRAEEDRQSIQL